MGGTSGGKRSAGKRAGSRPPRRFHPELLGLALGVTGSVVAWGYLVWAAIDFGTTARNGDEQAWWFLAIAATGAVVCLFLGLVLLARISRALGITRVAPPTAPPAASTPPPTPTPPSDPGGRRASR